MNTPIHVAICDCNTMARSGIIAMLQSQQHFIVTHEFANGNDLLAESSLQSFEADIIILDGDASVPVRHSH